MGTTTTGKTDVNMNDYAFDQSMHQTWTENSYSASGLARMTRVDSWCASYNGAGTGGAVAWMSDVAQMQVTNEGIGAVGGGAPTYQGGWHSATGDIPTNGEQWKFGFYMSGGVAPIIRDNGGGNTYLKASGVSNSTGGTNVSAYTGHAGPMASYGTYFIVTIYKKEGGSWVKKWFRKKGAGGSTTLPKTNKRVGGAWTQVGHLAEDIAFDPVKQFEIMFQDDDGLFKPGLLMFEGPYYLGPSWAIEAHKYGWPESAPYELVAA
jgi:hypothetical protein